MVRNGESTLVEVLFTGHVLRMVWMNPQMVFTVLGSGKELLSLFSRSVDVLHVFPETSTSLCNAHLCHKRIMRRRIVNQCCFQPSVSNVWFLSMRLLKAE